MRRFLLKRHDNEMCWILCPWMDYDELEWVGSGNVKGNVFKGRHNEGTRDFRSMDWKHLRGSRTESSRMRTEGALWNPSRGGSSSKRRKICFYESELNLGF